MIQHYLAMYDVGSKRQCHGYPGLPYDIAFEKTVCRSGSCLCCVVRRHDTSMDEEEEDQCHWDS